MSSHSDMHKHLDLQDRSQAESQKANREWALIGVTGLAVLVSIVAGFDVHRSADAAAKSLNIAVKSLNLQEKSMEMSQRPYVGVENPVIQKGNAVLQLRVYGNSPAKVISIVTTCEFTHFPPRAEDGGGGGADIPEGEREVLNPGERSFAQLSTTK